MREKSYKRTRRRLIRELVSGGFRLDLLLKTAKLAHSTYYYQLKRFNRANKDKKVKEMIQTIYDDHKGNYGYRRIQVFFEDNSYAYTRLNPLESKKTTR